MRRVRDYSITEKLTWMNILASAVALLLACAGFSIWDLTLFRQGMVRRLSVEAQIAGANCISALVFNDQPAAENTLAALKAAPHVIYAGIYTPEGKLFAGYWRDRRGEEMPLPADLAVVPEAHWFGDGQLVLVRSIAFQGKRPGTILIRNDLDEITSLLRQYVVIGAAVLGVCFSAVLVLSVFLRRSIAEPIVRLAETVRLVSRGKNYSVRGPGTDRRDELGVLIEAFNEMLAQIQERDGALRDAHDRLEQRVDERTAQLKAANKELEVFSYSVSHDLRAPLRQVDGFAEILIEEYGAQLDSKAQRYLSIIRAGAKNMGRLVDALLNMGRLGRQELLSKPTNLSLLLDEVLREIEPECNSRKIDWRIGTLPTVDCDPGLMKQVFVNLLSNAVKYTRRRELAVIQVDQIMMESGAPAIFVRDNGAGFNQKYASKLFGVFQRLHRAEDFEGTGMGLATVQRIIEKHAGRIWVEAEVEKGATFFFTLGRGEVTRAHQTMEVNDGTRGS